GRGRAATGDELGRAAALRYDGTWLEEALTGCTSASAVALALDSGGGVHAAVARVVPFAVPETLRTQGWSPRTDGAVKGRSREPEILYTRRDAAGRWSEPAVAAHGLAWHPALALVDDGPLIVYQSGGHKRV